MSIPLDKTLKVLEPEMLNTLRSLDSFKGLFLNELIDIFQSDSYPVLDRLVAAIQEDNEVLSMRLAHKLKGMGQNLGTDRLGFVLEHIEVNFPSYTAEVKADLPEQLRIEHEAVVRALRNDWYVAAKAS